MKTRRNRAKYLPASSKNITHTVIWGSYEVFPEMDFLFIIFTYLVLHRRLLKYISPLDVFLKYIRYTFNNTFHPHTHVVLKWSTAQTQIICLYHTGNVGNTLNKLKPVKILFHSFVCNNLICNK